MAVETLEIQITADNKQAIDALRETEGGLTNVSSAYRKQVAEIEGINKANTQNVATNKLLNVSLLEMKERLVDLKATLAATHNPEVFLETKAAIISTTAEIKQMEAASSKLGLSFGETISGARKLQFILRSFAGIGLFAIFNAAYVAIEQAATAMGLFDYQSKEAKKDQDEFNKSLEEARSKALATGFQLQAFIDIAKDGSKPMSERNEALKEANKLMGDHGKVITLANVATKDITDQTNNFTEALIQQAVALKYADRIADLYIKQTEAAKKYTESLKEQTNAQTNLVNAQKNANPDKDLNTGNSAVNYQLSQVEKAKNDRKDAVKDYRNYNDQVRDLAGNLKTATDKASELFGAMGNKTKTKIYPEAKDREKIKLGPESEVEKISVKLDIDIDKKDQLAAIFRDTGIDEAKQKLNAYREAIGNLIKIIETPIKGTVAEKAFQQLEKYKAENLIPILINQVEQLQALEEKKIDKSRDNSPLLKEAGDRDVVKLNQQKEAQTKLADATKDAQAGANLAAQAFTTMFNAMENGENVGEALSKMFQNLIKQLAAMVIQALAFKAIMTALGFGEVGAAKGAAGILGGLFGARAGGGSVQGGGAYLVGENGPEIFHPSTSGGITPNNMLNAASRSMGASSQQGTGGGAFTLRGQDLVLALQRSNYSLDVRR